VNPIESAHAVLSVLIGTGGLLQIPASVQPLPVQSSRCCLMRSQALEISSMITFCGALHFVSCFDGLILYATRFLLYLLLLLLDVTPFFTTLCVGKMSLNQHLVCLGF
jgi:hypothetical protein